MFRSSWQQAAARGPKARRRARRQPTRARLRLESLETRDLLATLTATALNLPAVEGMVDANALVATFTDSDSTRVAANFTATINYGDGTAVSTSAVIAKTGATTYNVNDTHTFPEESGSVVPPGAFTVSVRIHDITGGAADSTSTSSAFVNDAPLFPGNPVSAGSPAQITGVGTANVTAALASFRTNVGGASNNGRLAPQTGGFRTINWDGVRVDGTDSGGPPNTIVIDPMHTVGIPLNRFQGQGVYFGAIYAVSNNGYATINPNLNTLLTPFSAPNVFAMFNDNGIDFKFVAPSPTNTTIVSAAARGFGAVFENVRLPNTTSIEFFNGGGHSLGKFFVPPSATTGDQEFLGVLFNNPIVTNVVLTLGTDVLFSFDGTTFSHSGVLDDGVTHNFVSTDDWIFAEPVPIANGFPIVTGAQGTTNAAVTVNAVAGTAFTGVVATFSDTDPAGNARDYTATINWGDGHSTNGTITANTQGGFDVSGTNTYAQPGLFPINVDIMDFGGGPGSGGSQPTLSVNNTARVKFATANQRYVAGLYQDLLGRPVDATGLAIFSNALDTGASRTQVVNAILSSPEYRTDLVQGFYTLYLHRTADLGGLNTFVTALQNGGTVEQVQAAILGSLEYFQVRGMSTNDGFLNAIYQDALNRMPDATGRMFFNNQLMGTTTRAQVAAEILSSPEYFQDLVQSFYMRFLHRTADTGGLNGFVGALQNGARDEQVIALFLTSNEYVGQF